MFSIYIATFLNVIYSCDGKSESLLQSSVSHDPSETILKGLFGAQETFLTIIHFGCLMFMWKPWCIFEHVFVIETFITL